MTDAIRVANFEELRKAFAMFRRQLGITQLQLDDLAGLQSGYTSTLECGNKRYGDMSLSCTLGALGLEMVVVRASCTHSENDSASTPSVSELKKLLAARNKRAAQARWSRPRTEEDRAAARRAARTRWRKWREAKAERERREKRKGSGKPKAKPGAGAER